MELFESFFFQVSSRRPPAVLGAPLSRVADFSITRGVFEDTKKENCYIALPNFLVNSSVRGSAFSSVGCRPNGLPDVAY